MKQIKLLSKTFRSQFIEIGKKDRYKWQVVWSRDHDGSDDENEG